MNALQYKLYRLKYRYGHLLALRKPVDISLELSSVCNMACTYCYHGDKANLPFKMKFMEWDTARSILRQGAELGVNSVKTNWRGESTLNPKFENITRLAKSYAEGMTYIDRITNSNFKFNNNRDDIFRGLCNQTVVKVSYDSFNKEVFEKQRALGDHDLTTANIDRFYNWRGRNNRLVIQAVRTTRNKDEDFEYEIRSRWPSAELSVRDVVPGRSDKNYDALLVKEQSQKRQSCRQAHVRLIFDYSGKPTVCCPDIKNQLSKLGDIHTHTMYEMFNSDFVKNLRQELRNGKAFLNDPCKTCSSHETYVGYEAPWKS